MIAAAHRGGHPGRILMVTAGMSAKESSSVLKLGASDEAAGVWTGIGCRLAGEQYFDRAVMKTLSLENGIGFAVGNVRPSLKPDGLLSIVLDAGNGGTVGLQLVYALGA